MVQFVYWYLKCFVIIFTLECRCNSHEELLLQHYVPQTLSNIAAVCPTSIYKQLIAQLCGKLCLVSTFGDSCWIHLCLKKSKYHSRSHANKTNQIRCFYWESPHLAFGDSDSRRSTMIGFQKLCLGAFSSHGVRAKKPLSLTH